MNFMEWNSMMINRFNLTQSSQKQRGSLLKTLNVVTNICTYNPIWNTTLSTTIYLIASSGWRRWKCASSSPAVGTKSIQIQTSQRQSQSATGQEHATMPRATCNMQLAWFVSVVWHHLKICLTIQSLLGFPGFN